MIKKFTEHPSKQGESYFQHMFSAWGIIFLLKKLEIKCFIHSIFPFLYVNAVSSKLECLKKMTTRKSVEIENELYEIYGGD